MHSKSIRAIVIASSVTSPAALAAQEMVIQLPAITIHADRRNEALKDQPRAVSVLGENDLAATPGEPGAGIALNAPGLTFSGFGQPGTDFLNIRGVGPLGYPLSATDHIVAYSVNEVPTSAFGFPPAMFDMEQTEVFRGPQGTVFGRNALAGGINFVPRAADGVRERRFAAEIGTDGHRMADLVFGGWLVPDRVAGRVALRFQDYDGDIANTVAGGKEGGAALSAARLSLTAYTQDGWDISAMLQGDRRKTHNSFTLWYEHPNFPESGANRLPQNSRENRQAIVKIGKDFGGVRFTSLTGFQRQDLEGDGGASDAYLMSALTGMPPTAFADPDGAYFLTREREDIFSQELRLSSEGEGPLSWVVGANYFRSGYAGRRDAKSPSQPTSNGVTDVDIRTKSWSLFADGTWSLSDRLRLSGGLRHGWESQSVDGVYVSNGFPGTLPRFAQSDKIEDRYTTGRLGLSYDITPEAAAYVTVSRGYAAGGYEKLLIGSATGVRTAPFAAATNTAFEAGLKYAAPDDRLRANLALFRNDVKNGQMFDFESRGGVVHYIFTNQDYRSFGLELDGAYQVTEGLRLRGSVTLLNSKMRNVSPTTGTGARNGNKVPLTPAVSTMLGLDYRLAAERIGLSGDVTVSADWAHVGTRQADIGNQFTMPAYDIVNARISWQQGNRSFYAFANNILDERPLHYSSQYTPKIHTASVGAGRIIGLGMTLDF